jgi:hypothetical protein
MRAAVSWGIEKVGWCEVLADHCDLLSWQNEIIHNTLWRGLCADLPFSNHNEKFDESYGSALKNLFHLMTDTDKH